MKRFVAITAALSLCLLCALAATASAVVPSATTGSASGVNASSADVNGTVNPNGESTSYSFQFGTTAAYGLQTNPQSAGSGTQDQTVSATLTGLTAGTTYHYRLIATNTSGTTVGTDRTFTTSGSPPPSSSPPTATTGAAVAVGQSRATVRGTVNPKGAKTTYYFEYGLTPAYGAQSNARSLAAGNSARAVSTTLTGLKAGRTYHYRLVARNANGLNVGADRTFSTSAAPRVGSVPRLTSNVAPFRDRRRPFRFTVRGRVILPAGVSRARGCRGRVTIRFKAGKKTLRLRRARLNSNCRYGARVLVRARRTPRILRVSARFGGNAVLDARSARTRKVRVG